MLGVGFEHLGLCRTLLAGKYAQCMRLQGAQCGHPGQDLILNNPRLRRTLLAGEYT